MTAPRRLAEVLLAVVLLLASVVLVLTDAPAPVRAPVVLLAVGATAVRLARHRRRGGLDTALVAVGGSLVVLVLLGLVLGIAVGLSPVTWVVGLTVPALLALTASALRPPRPADADATDADPDDATDATDASAPQEVQGRPGRRSALLAAPWVAASVAVTVVALGLSLRGAADAEQAPVQMSFASVQGAEAVVVVSADDTTGPLELRTDPGDGSAVTYPLFTVPAGGAVSTTVVVPTTGKVVVTVNNPGQSRPLRTLVVNR